MSRRRTRCGTTQGPTPSAVDSELARLVYSRLRFTLLRVRGRLDCSVFHSTTTTTSFTATTSKRRRATTTTCYHYHPVIATTTMTTSLSAPATLVVYYWTTTACTTTTISNIGDLTSPRIQPPSHPQALSTRNGMRECCDGGGSRRKRSRDRERHGVGVQALALAPVIVAVCVTPCWCQARRSLYMTLIVRVLVWYSTRTLVPTQ